MRFREWAHTYDDYAFIQRDLVEWGLRWFPPVGRFSAALELGAGTGMLTRHLAARFAQVQATDLAPEMVRVGAQAVPEANWGVMNAWEPSGGPYDFICSSSLLQWAPDPAQVLQHMKQCLKPGGEMTHLLFIVPTMPEFAAIAPDWQPLTWRDAQTWKHAFAEAGLEVRRTEEDSRAVHFTDCCGLLRFIQRTGTAGGDYARPARLREFMREYDTRYGRGKGVLSTWTFFAITATRP